MRRSLRDQLTCLILQQPRLGSTTSWFCAGASANTCRNCMQRPHTLQKARHAADPPQCARVVLANSCGPADVTQCIVPEVGDPPLFICHLAGLDLLQIHSLLVASEQSWSSTDPGLAKLPLHAVEDASIGQLATRWRTSHAQSMIPLRPSSAPVSARRRPAPAPPDRRQQRSST